MRFASRALSLAIASLFALPLAADPTASTDAKARVAALQAALKGTDDDAKKTAVENCGLTPGSTTASALAAVLSKESDALRMAAAQSLGKMKRIPEAVQVLHGGLGANMKKSDVLEAIFVSLAALKDRSSITVCRDFAIQMAPTKDVEMVMPVKAALEALGAFKHKDSVDALVTVRARLAANAAAIQPVILTAAGIAASASQEKLTGEPAPEAAVFAKWWKRHHAEFNDDMTKRPVSARRSGDGSGGGGE
jgi:hypothetical protein